MDEICQATFHIADDRGDNEATMRCQLPTGHTGQHIESLGARGAVLVWEHDDS